MLKKAFLWAVFVVAGLLLLIYYYGAAGIDYSITINGEEIHGLQEVAFATGGLLVAGLAVVGVLALVALVLAGASMVLLGVFAFFFLGLLFLFSPVWVPVAGFAIVIALLYRKRKSKGPADKRCW
ncbi:MAG: hypothetical protein WC633_04825 [Desulfurivibrionaceae bacterium]|jgi:hypothetical protein